MSICNQTTNIPSTDNTPLPCSEGLFSSNCILHEEAISFLGLPENSTITDVIKNLLLSLIDARQRIELLENI